MMHDHPRHGAPWHSPGCRCRRCDAPAPSRRRAGPRFDAIVRLLLAGIAAGTAIAWLFNRVTAGPGLLAAVFGS